MAYKDKIYDMTALEMFKRLELFLDGRLGQDKVRKEEWTVKRKIDKFADTEKENHPNIATLMHRMRKTRNDIVHPYAKSRDGKFRPHPEPMLTLDEFRNFHRDCSSLANNYPELRMKEMMIPTLRYDMGNAGDIIKHGLLAEFVLWYKSAKSGRLLRFADPFGGSPWGNLGTVVDGRLTKLKDTALFKAYPRSRDKYFGSSHLVSQVADGCGLDTRIDISDNNEDARCNLENSVSDKDSMELIESLPDNDGYAILDGDHPGRYGLILIDPYKEFLRDEFYNENKRFPRILDLVKKHSDLFVAVFVLDWKRQNDVGQNFTKLKQGELSDYTFSLRCPKFLPKKGFTVKGESDFDAEILLISQQIADKKCEELYKQLHYFAQEAAKALPLPKGEALELWGAHSNGTPDDPEKFPGSSV